ncbi:hypothetical protein TVAG_102730 [Trichomonas vaginalis G3]|uniref:Uncharacterized protein n=1 Tax=Trichomonas vaginalis (strain ATCC PRA-98 / G3) TaxID=412133 RepID=A2ECX9_TRIV3|nr:armadillo (ARM) repeat-containing protein family [Trichomonas vaginalis G3]EAY09524.1 hypothetical protein TVAG_102730 [Trichomonas vaginalis G3]KAI5512985.1 armadillo (ARM) repeat-containing protein family [Trichomonas vaginalis G3]|eukprot:XP_001321747.1 hypothetical protein [Trichomonas vaginalis G3]
MYKEEEATSNEKSKDRINENTDILGFLIPFIVDYEDINDLENHLKDLDQNCIKSSEIIDTLLSKSQEFEDQLPFLKVTLKLLKLCCSETFKGGYPCILIEYIEYNLQNFESAENLLLILKILKKLLKLSSQVSKIFTNLTIFHQIMALGEEMIEKDWIQVKNQILKILSLFLKSNSFYSEVLIAYGEESAVELLEKMKSLALCSFSIETAKNCLELLSSGISLFIFGDLFIDDSIIINLCVLINNEELRPKILKYLSYSAKKVPNFMVNDLIMDLDCSKFDDDMLVYSYNLISNVIKEIQDEKVLSVIFNSIFFNSLINFIGNCSLKVQIKLCNVVSLIIIHKIDYFDETKFTEICQFLCENLDSSDNQFTVISAVSIIFPKVEKDEAMISAIEDLADDIDNECSDLAFELLSSLEE